MTATVWRGEVMAVAAHDRRQTTENEPRDEPQMPAALGAAAALLALLSLVYGGVLLTGLGYGRITWKRHVWPLTGGLFVGSLVVGFVTVWLSVPWQLVPPVIVLGTAGALRLFLRRDEPAAPRSHRAPAPRARRAKACPAIPFGSASVRRAVSPEARRHLAGIAGQNYEQRARRWASRKPRSEPGS
ncbi:hypothetical protein O1L60_42945 [Streptomyces diastatochromogenes]|nr:hypothetical protein [Streptomyces diastatochromogenes]